MRGTKLVVCIAVGFLSSVLGSAFAQESGELITNAVTDWGKAIQKEQEASSYLEAKRASLSANASEEDLKTFGHSVREFVQAYPKNSARNVDLQRSALSSYIRAAEKASEAGKVKYTREISSLSVAVNDKATFTAQFENLLRAADEEKERYITLVDYADGLGKFRDPRADGLFDQAINMRAPLDSAEAHLRYARYLKDSGQPQRALEVLNRFSREDRQKLIMVAFTRQALMHSLGVDTVSSPVKATVLN